MMRKGSRQFDNDEYPKDRNVTVFDDDEPRYTGLVDAQGNPIVRRREPIGFALPKKDNTEKQ